MDRPALFWRNADVLLRADLLDWATAVEILRDRARWLWPAGRLWTAERAPRMVFEVFCLVDGGQYGVVTPLDEQRRTDE